MLPFGSFLKVNSSFARLYLRLIGVPYVYARLTAPLILKRLPEDRGSMILDAGCGVGLYSITLAKMGYTVIATDISPQKLEMVSTLRDSEKLSSSICVIPCDVCKMSMINDKMFDGVLMLDLMEHIHDDNSALSEVARVMKKDGTLIITTPNSDQEARKRWSTSMDKAREKEQGHVRDGYSKSGIASILETHGFVNVEVIEYFKLLAVWAWKFHYRFWKKFGSFQFEDLCQASNAESGFTNLIIIALTFPFLLILCKLDSIVKGVGSQLLVKAIKS